MRPSHPRTKLIGTVVCVPGVAVASARGEGIDWIPTSAAFSWNDRNRSTYRAFPVTTTTHHLSKPTPASTLTALPFPNLAARCCWS